MGDGTTSVAVLAGELLREAEQLIEQKIHPMIIIDGFRKACEVAIATLQVLSATLRAIPALNMIVGVRCA